MTEAAQKLRQQAGKWTDKEAALALGLPTWRIRRAVTLGALSFNTIGNGQIVVTESELWKLTSETGVPQAKGDWFDESRSFDHRYFRDYVERSSGDPFTSFKAEFLSTGLTLGEAMMINAAQTHAKYQLRNQNQKYGFRGKPTTLEGFYSIGPDKFRIFETDIKEHLNKLSFQLHGKSFEFGALCKFGFQSLITQCIRKAF